MLPTTNLTFCVWTLALTLGAYVVCGIPFGLIIAKREGRVDVRTVGSGNIGTTNVARSVGKKAAALTLLCDLGKGLVWMLLARWVLAALVFGGDAASLDHTTVFGASLSLVYMGCILGHVFSPFLGFHGGKGIAVGFGAALGLWWPVALGLLAVFLVFAVPSRYVSLGSVCAAASLPIQCALWGFPLISVAPIVVVALVVIWAHPLQHQEARPRRGAPLRLPQGRREARDRLRRHRWLRPGRRPLVAAGLPTACVVGSGSWGDRLRRPHGQPGGRGEALVPQRRGGVCRQRNAQEPAPPHGLRAPMQRHRHERPGRSALRRGRRGPGPAVHAPA